MPRRLCQLGSAVCASLGVTALTIGLLTLAHPAWAEETMTAVSCKNCAGAAGVGKKWADNKNARCGDRLCDECKCRNMAGTIKCAV